MKRLTRAIAGALPGRGCAEDVARAADAGRDIAFGSCINQLTDPMLQRVPTLPMDVFLFMGDNIYADTQDMALMRAKYDALKGTPFFRDIRAKATVLATWDDHDFGG